MDRSVRGWRRRGLAAAAGALLLSVPGACGSNDGQSASSSSSSGGVGGGGGFSSTGGGGPITDKCATATVEGQPIAVTMLIMFDKSGSMLLDQKWAGAKTALTAFFQDEASAGLSVGLRFFPDDEPVAGCNEIACDAGACAVPLVDAAPLNAQPAYADPQQQALVDAVASRSPGGETPMYAALAGAEQWAVGHADPGGDAETVVVLVTDGDPNGCNEDPAAIAALAGSAYASSGVLTYAIGMQGANMAQLDLIATAGGSDKAFVVGGANVHKELRAALDEIRKAKIACVLPVPDSQQVGQEVNPGEVNVTFTPSGGEQVVLGQVGGPSDCAGGGWYYDDPVAPTTITLCPETCDVVQGDVNGIIEVVLGCKTVLK